MALWMRIRNALAHERLDAELDAELRAHLEEAQAAGRNVDEARRAFGGLLRIREQSHDVKVLGWLESLVSDARFGWRQLRKRWVISVAAVLSLALAIGACTGAFRLIDAVLFRPLPVAHPERLYYLTFTLAPAAGMEGENDWFSYPLYREMRQAIGADAELLAIGYASRWNLSYGNGSAMERITGQYVSGNTFAAFGLQPALGRLLTPADDRTPGTSAVAVLSYDYWTSRFNRDPRVLGRTFHLGRIYQIVGVAPKGFTGTETGSITSIFLPAMMNDKAIENAGWGWLRTWVIPRPGSSPEALRQRLQVVFTNHRKARMNEWIDASATQQKVDEYLKVKLELRTAANGASETRQAYARALLMLGFMVALILFIAAANIANLMIVQSVARAREMALRVSIGAGRGRLVQLVLVESALLAALSAIPGALFAWWSAPAVAAMVNPPDRPLQLALPADWRVLGFAIAIGAATTLFFGLLPALRASSVRPGNVLRGGDETRSRHRLLPGLVAMQVAFCFLVTFLAGLFVATFERLANQPAGFLADRILLLESIGVAKPEPARIWQKAATHLGSMPNVEAVAISRSVLMSGDTETNSIQIPGRPPENEEPYFLSISPGFLSTMKIPLLGGRDFRATDTGGKWAAGKDTPGVAIVSEEFVNRYFPHQNPIGKLFLRSEGANRTVRVQIVGYVHNLRYRSLREPIRPVVLLPLGEADWATFAIRTSTPDPASLAPSLRSEVLRVTPELRVANTYTQREVVDQWTIRERLLAALSVFFAGLALLLAGIGLYGVLNNYVLQRRREIGIRMALGATVRHVVSRVTAPVAAMFAGGVTAGLGAAWWSQRLLEELLYAVRATDLSMLAIPLGFLLLAALAAALPPAVLATRVDPAETLRSE